jgi:type II secretory pathway pseudopilin PulG
MTRSSRHSALTLVEILVVLGIMAILFAIGVPAVKKIVESFDSSANVRSVITAALSHARSLAMAGNTYVGIRFQPEIHWKPAVSRYEVKNTYMVLIRYDFDATGLDTGFRAVEDRKPVKLPESIGIIDGIRVTRKLNGLKNDILIVAEDPIAIDANLDQDEEFFDASTFSIIFDKSGRLVTHEVRVRNRFGVPGGDVSANENKTIPDIWALAPDDIFNLKKMAFDDTNNLSLKERTLLCQDDYLADFGPESSRNSFVIYDKKKFNAVPVGKQWSLYLKLLPKEYVNPNTGELVGMR